MADRPIPRPPFATDLLADLHADNVPADVAAELWPAVHQDPGAVRYLRSLDTVNDRLRALGTDTEVLHPMPDAVRDRLDALLDQLAADPATAGVAEATAPVRDLDRYRARRRRLLTAAAAAVPLLALVVAAVVAGHNDSGGPSALPRSQPSGTAAADGGPVPAALLQAMGRNDVTGPLAAPGALVACVRAAGTDHQILGSTDTTFQGRPAALILVAGPQPPTITAFIVGTGCAPGDPQLLIHRDIG